MNQETKDKLADIIWYIKGQLDIHKLNGDWFFPFDQSHIDALIEAKSQKPSRVFIDRSVVVNHFISDTVVDFEQLKEIANNRGSVYLSDNNAILPAAFVCNLQYRDLDRRFKNGTILKLVKIK